MNTRPAAILLSALATTSCLLLAGCTDSSDGSDQASGAASSAAGSATGSASASASASGATSDGASTAPSESAGSGGIASASPSTVPAPEKSDGVSGVEVELSSSSSAAGEPVQVTVTVPKGLAKESVVLVSPAEDDSWNVITAPVQVNKDLQAFMTVDMGKTMTFRAIVPKDDVSDEVSLPADAPILGQSEEFTITVS